MTYNGVLIVAIHICVVCIVPIEQSKLYWEILNPPITFGSDVQLVCYTTCCIKQSNETASWVMGAEGNSKSLSKNLKSTNDSKYTILTSENECRLEIKNFGPNDGNQLYSCYYNFQGYGKKLTLDAHTFESQPGKDDIIVEEGRVDDRYTIVANITNAFPEPVCEAFIGHTNLSKSLEISTQPREILVDVKIKIIIDIVDGTFRLTCRIGNSTHVIKETAFIQNNADCASKWFYPFVVTFVIAAIACCSTAALSYINRKKCGNREFKMVDTDF